MSSLLCVRQWFDDFNEPCIGVTNAFFGKGWRIADTSSAGTPTYATVDGSESGEFKMTLDSQAEAENVCLYNGDVLSYRLGNIQSFKTRVKIENLNSVTDVAFGLCSDRNDDTDLIETHAMFKVDGSSSISTVLVETDDGVIDVDDVAASPLGAGWIVCEIDFTQGFGDVRFYSQGANQVKSRRAPWKKFDMSNAVDSFVQPFFQIQKASGAGTGSISIDFVEINYKSR